METGVKQLYAEKIFMAGQKRRLRKFALASR